MADTPDTIIGLIERFERNKDSYKGPAYNETQLRQEFLNPFFEALGWDVRNTAGHAEAYKDVIHEDAIKIGGISKAPDYCFRIGGVRKFFLEAKKPAVNIEGDITPAYQLRRYAWNAKLPLSILSDFEEFAIYDCRIPPKPNDKPSTGRVSYLKYHQYESRWSEIADVFSKDAVLKGSFDRYAVSTRGKRGTSEVDAEFLAEIERWRDALARNVALRNPQLSVRDLNFAVQATIDRIIFLRMCEDRGIENYAQLLALLSGEAIYGRLKKLYHDADHKYNSGLFHFEREKGREGEPDELTLNLTIDDKVLKEIIGRLYYPESPYEFSVLPPEILGNVYEQFLGKVIRLTKGHQARVEEKPEVKKAGGVYYTPSYIVQYIVKNTVGKLCEGKTPRQIAKLRILDPACGSGSFLLGAYTWLLDHHRDWYAKNPAGHSKQIYQGHGGQWHLTTAEKKRILLNNIYGVDIDSQAVEVTKLSLLLKVLEGESKETIERQRLLFAHERALPDLDSNIKCGNSLIGPDFYRRGQMTLFGEDERWRINAFDWNAEFPEIMNSGGFHTVIGNPPWGQKEIAKDSSIISHVRAKFPSSCGIFDMFRPFVELGIQKTKPEGLWGMVLPDILLLKNYPTTRQYILETVAINSIHFWGMAFQKAVIDAITIIGKKERSATLRAASQISIQVKEKGSELVNKLPQKHFLRTKDFKFNLFLDSSKLAILAHLDRSPRFSNFLEVHEGVHSGNARAKLFVERSVNSSCAPLILGRKEVQRFALEWNGLWLNRADNTLDRRAGEYANLGRPDWYAKEKLVIRRTGDHLVCSLDTEGYYFSNNVFIMFHRPDDLHDLRYVLGLLNSKLMTWYYLTIQPRKRRVFSEVKINHVNDFPFRRIELDNAKDKALYDRMVSLVDQMLDLHKKLAAAKNPDEKTRLQRAIDATDNQIDALVYELYGLNNKEIKIIEEREWS